MITLNSEQLEAKEDIELFLEDDAKKEYFLIGRAGTGKTTAIRFVDFPSNRKVIGVAVSHKAKEVLRESISDITGELYTIAKLLGMERQRDFTQGTEDFVINKFKMQPIPDKLVILVDECSMINNSHRKNILMYYPNSKIIYIGDDAQLPPIKGEAILKKEAEMTVRFSKLTTNMRSGTHNPLMIVLNDIIKHQNKGTRINLDIIGDFVTSGKGYIFNVHPFTFWNKDTTVICFTNKRKVEWNTIIRKRMGMTTQLEVGDKLIFNAPFQTKSKTISYMNSEVVEVEKIDKTNVEIVLNRRTGDSFSSKAYLVNKSFVRLSLEGQRRLDQKLVSLAEKANDAKGKNRRIIWSLYYKLKDFIPDTSFAYAITSHKSQGSSYAYTIVDYENISRIRSNVDCMKSLYVAISRTKKISNILTHTNYKLDAYETNNDTEREHSVSSNG